MVKIDRMILGISTIISGIVSVFGINIIDPPLPPPALSEILCTTMKNVQPDYLNIGFTILGALLIIFGVFIVITKWEMGYLLERTYPSIIIIIFGLVTMTILIIGLPNASLHDETYGLLYTGVTILSVIFTIVGLMNLFIIVSGFSELVDMVSKT